jgi:hypothetical protein
MLVWTGGSVTTGDGEAAGTAAAAGADAAADTAGGAARSHIPTAAAPASATPPTSGNIQPGRRAGPTASGADSARFAAVPGPWALASTVGAVCAGAQR